MRSLLLRWLILTLAVVLAAHLVPGVHIESTGTAFLVAVVLSLLNAVLRPVLILLTLPLHVLTLGLFSLVINALLLAATAWLVAGFSLSGPGAAFLGALVISAVSVVVNWMVGR
ncbi:MAG: phage holin family protein [Myxococcales bacterium]|nr:phage holin family protein [Myxococcota bacterium]MDW8282791.1 phage holin family protein [Myxococcales bacterium]